MTRTVSVIIPVRPHETLAPVMTTLMAQTFQDFEIIVQVDPGFGQAWARNQGAQIATGEYLWFSDADITWAPTALERHLEAFKFPAPRGFELAYTYGGYELLQQGRLVQTLCDRPWNWGTMHRENMVSTMALVRRSVFLDFLFDETFRRLEDWELWLRMGMKGYGGAYCGGIMFTTELRPGVTFSGQHSHETYEALLRGKLGL